MIHSSSSKISYGELSNYCRFKWSQEDFSTMRRYSTNTIFEYPFLKESDTLWETVVVVKFTSRHEQVDPRVGHPLWPIPPIPFNYIIKNNTFFCNYLMFQSTLFFKCGLNFVLQNVIFFYLSGNYGHMLHAIFLRWCFFFI